MQIFVRPIVSPEKVFAKMRGVPRGGRGGGLKFVFAEKGRPPNDHLTLSLMRFPIFHRPNLHCSASIQQKLWLDTDKV